MLITDYEKVKTLLRDNIFLIDGSTGTRSILAEDAAVELVKMLDAQEFAGQLQLPELTQSDIYDENDKILIGNTAGNKAMSMKHFEAVLSSHPDFYFDLIQAGVGDSWNKRNTFRGKNLGTVFTEEQKKTLEMEVSKDCSLEITGRKKIGRIESLILITTKIMERLRMELHRFRMPRHILWSYHKVLCMP